jgi:hypothetical protein
VREPVQCIASGAVSYLRCDLMSDWVIDLQYVPQPLDVVGELCGFNGNGHHCHKGVLTRCKWMYNDIKRLVSLFNELNAFCLRHTAYD